jgi:AcrR family transcriptional regulator
MIEERPRNRQALRSRRRLQEALLALLREKPYSKITVTEIAGRADLARPTFYAHFETKDDLLLSYVDDIFEPVFCDLDNGLGPSSDESAAIQLNTRLFKAWQDNAEVMRLLRTADVDPLIMTCLKSYYRRVYHASHPMLAPDGLRLSPALAGYLIDFVASATLTLLTRWLDEKMRHSPEVMGQLLYDLTGSNRLRDVIERWGD